MIYLIQGVFFQDNYFINLGRYEGLAWCLDDGNLGVFVYTGIIRTDEGAANDSPFLTGNMHDIFGKSNLTNVVLTETELRFMKLYRNREPIFYTFKKQPDGTSR